jgi:hypothetical protein
MFLDGGYRVAVNGVIRVGAGTNPFVDLAASMSPELWRRVSRELAPILDPQNGGDVRLFRFLERAIEAAVGQSLVAR